MKSEKTSELVQALRAAIQGDVKFDQLTRHLYSTDASCYRIVPIGVALPRDVEDISAIIQVAAEFNIPVLPRGGGTSLSGQSVGEAIIIDTSRYLDKILEVNIEERWVRAQAGAVLDILNQQLRSHGLMFGPDPASGMAATLGGMLGNNSSGTHSILYGMTADHTLELEVVLGDGTPVIVSPHTPLPEPLNDGLSNILTCYRTEIETRYPKTWRSVAGYGLDRLIRPNANPAHIFVGSEGTLGVITAAKLKVVDRPKETRLAIIQFDELRQALEMVPMILETGPAAIEMIDRFFLNLTRQLPGYARRLTFVEGDPRCVLIVEYMGTSEAELESKLITLTRRLRAAGHLEPLLPQITPAEIANVWAVRKAGFGLLMSMRGDAKPLAFVDDATVPVIHLAEYAQGVENICRELGTEPAFYAHASAGCLHINPLINLKSSAGNHQMREIAGRVAELAISFGGTTTGEHGEGLARSCFNELLFGARLHQAFKEVKALFDPDCRLNPGKIVDAPDMATPEILRFNAAYRTPYAPVQTTLDFSTTGGYAGLVEMCNGQGACRGLTGGAMCPSFMATRDERHSVRGRANALRAAISGELGPEAMTSDELYQTLDLCLACKSCKTECPSAVDMAKLKVEFLSQYQDARGVPLRSLLFGHIAEVNRLGQVAKPLANWAFINPIIRKVMEHTLGVDHRRGLPLLAPVTFETWFRQRSHIHSAGAGPDSGDEVVFFHDTFVNYNEPSIGQAAVEVLEAAGYRIVLVPKVCCGRPLISRGLLKAARRNAAHNIHVLVPYAERGVPIVGCEPSCIATLRDEYIDFFPGDSRAKLVAENAFFLDEWIVNQARQGQFNLSFDATPRSVLYHPHCHQRALSDIRTMAELFALIPNCEARSDDAGCCGMAGSFGYEISHYDLSLKIGEERMFPAIRAADQGTWISAPGTSCRHQIYEGTGRKPLHPIEILGLALSAR